MTAGTKQRQEEGKKQIPSGNDRQRGEGKKQIPFGNDKQKGERSSRGAGPFIHLLIL
jgi:hypothetical protein